VQYLVFLFDNWNTQSLRIPSLITEIIEFIRRVTGIEIKLPE
jgi:hypothetical protein